jgi:glucokinase
MYSSILYLITLLIFSLITCRRCCYAITIGSNGLVEAGHMIVDSSLSTARKCGCGQYGCAEVYSSAKNMAIRMYEEDKRQNDCKTRNDVSDADRIRDDDSDNDNHEEVIMAGIDLSAQHVFERYLHSDPLAVKIMEETADYLSVLAINICRVVDPEIIIFSGGLAKAGDIFLALVRDKMKQRTWTVLPTDVQLVIARSIDNGGMVGAALAAKKLI